jgi:hypothetical protein
VVQALSEAQEGTLADIVAGEVCAAQDELDNRAMLTELGQAIASGGVELVDGKLYSGCIDLRRLNESISLAVRLRPKTVEAQQLLLTAKALRKLREAVLAANFKEAALVLKTIQGRNLASVAQREVKLVRDGLDDWVRAVVSFGGCASLLFVSPTRGVRVDARESSAAQIIESDLVTAMGQGRPAGAVGFLDLSCMDIDPLIHSIKRAEEVGYKSKEAKITLDSAKLVRRLRAALASGSWHAVSAVLSDAKLVTIAECALPEIQLVQDELDNRQMAAQMCSALEEGGLSGSVGSLDLTTLTVAALDRYVCVVLTLLLYASLVLSCSRALVLSSLRRACRASFTI